MDNVFICAGCFVYLPNSDYLTLVLAQFVECAFPNNCAMEKKDFRNYSALLILTVLIDRTTNPAKTAVFWANELMKELYDKEDDEV